MVATGVIVVKGWQLYGPSTEQVKTFAVAQAMEKAQIGAGPADRAQTNAAPISARRRSAARCRTAVADATAQRRLRSAHGRLPEAAAEHAMPLPNAGPSRDAPATPPSATSAQR